MTADWRRDAVRDLAAREALLISIPDPEDRAGVSALIDLVVAQGATLGHAVEVVRDQVVIGRWADDTLRRRLARVWAAVDAERDRTRTAARLLAVLAAADSIDRLLTMRDEADHVAHMSRHLPALTIRTDYGTYDLRPRHGGPGYEATRR